MPFINGRYHINPAMGQALDAAREADAARLALGHDAHPSSPDDDFAAPPHASAVEEKGPIHHIEIEAAELEGLPGPRQGEPGRSVPSHTGRATHGFVARIHRLAPQEGLPGRRQMGPPSPRSGELGGSVEPGRSDAAAAPLRPETHVFTDHRDLIDFLRNELADDCSRS